MIGPREMYVFALADRIRYQQLTGAIELSQSQDLPKLFDEQVARKYPTINGNWEELAVVWRPGRIELWGEYVSERTSLLSFESKF